ncbi:MAG: S-methyl-5'-thioadenosine phosphorylase [Candidatus Brocadiaceae bacterium]|jgi:5'-methylthioadenosine phosphorylase
MAEQGTIGVIGGSGLYAMDALEVVDEVAVSTPFGDPSDRYVLGELAGRRVAFLPRHGRRHSLLPGELNFRANIYGFKKLGVDRLVSVSAVGSMKEEIAPLHIVLPDQFIDRTRGRVETFFGEGAVAHVSLADPVCPELHEALREAAASCEATVWPDGTYVCIEGPTFSTRAESYLYRSWGVSVIGMTNLPEAKLAREAEMCYATIALVTDYDCWHETEEAVSGEMVLQRLMQNVETAQGIVGALMSVLPAERSCGCGDALRKALVTPPSQIPAGTKDELDIILGKYVE